MKISGTSKAMAWVAGAAVGAGVALATYPDAAPAVPPQVPSAEVLQSAVKVAGLIESSSVVDQVPNVSGYQRGCGKGESCSFGPAWTDDYDGPGGHDGCDSRNNVLAQQLTAIETKPGTRNCVVIAGTLQDSYTGTTIEFEKANASAVQIDHVYPLARAWKMGASTWTVDKRIQFANDIDRNLMAVDGPTNGKKSDKGLDEWMPPNTAYGCEYAARYLTVARDYGLSVTTGDLHSASLACGLDPEITKEK
ncbi:HNH endonuclease family protein [Rhodococcus erythropolis]|uniref:HNH endonuclease family protein n=1 Tax=Rhodococcus erythropolis TaxID=1833 RepID=UPI002225EF54|nr:HNH endonuclease family protein [Rhodococcus erythropolis]MCW2295323.1 hypothetical protein [Rhodococcus erythropolis]